MQSLIFSALIFSASCTHQPSAFTHSTESAPSSSVRRIQAWQDAEALAAMDPDRLTVIGVGESMRPVYGDNTVLVLQRVPFEALSAGMRVAYRKRTGQLVVHVLVRRDKEGWRAEGLNNPDPDAEPVTAGNLVGVVYAVFLNRRIK